MHSFYPLITVYLFALVLLHLDPVVASTRAQQTRHARQTSSLSPSPDTCPADYKLCAGGGGSPTGFCCRENESCVRLADDTTVVCCPEGEDCDTIRPITCDIAGQDAAAHPTAPVHTTNLTGALPACGSDASGGQTCCPFGYACSDDSSECVRSDGGASWTGARSSVDTPSFTSTLTISGSTASATALIVASSTVSVPIVTTPTSPSGGHASSGSSLLSQSSSSSTKTRTIAIAAGSATGGLACAVGVIVFFWMMRKRRRRQRRAHTTEANKPPRPRRPETQFSETPPPLPPKEPHQLPKKKRRSILSWVPSVVNRTPAELPATPVSFSAWDCRQQQWDQVGPRPPNPAHRPYPRDSISIEEMHELEAEWLPPQARHEVHYR